MKRPLKLSIRVFLSIVASLLLGVGCRSGGKTDAVSGSLALRPGLAFTVRPSILGVSGSVDQLLGLDATALQVRVTATDADRRVIVWTGASASGTIAIDSYATADAMLLPVFWQEGDVKASRNGGLWLSRAAYDDLAAGRDIEWKVGLADNALSSASTAVKTFNALSFRIFGSATAVPELSPFTVKKTGRSDAYPLTVDGKIVLLKVVQASGWFADLVILDDPENPLILKVAVHPVAEPALKALESARIPWDGLGYEITSAARP